MRVKSREINVAIFFVPYISFLNKAQAVESNK